MNFPGNFYQSDVKSVLELLIFSLLPAIVIIMFLLTTNVEIMIWLTDNRTPDNTIFLRIYVLQQVSLSINEYCINVLNYWFYFIYCYHVYVAFFYCRILKILLNDLFFENFSDGKEAAENDFEFGSLVLNVI